MVAKAHGGGASFAGAAAYCLGMARETLDGEREGPGVECRVVEPSERVEWTDVRNLATTDIRKAGRPLAATTQYAGELKRLAGRSQAGRPLAKPVYHYTLSWGQDERPGAGRDEPGNDGLKLSRWAERWEREHGGLRCERRAEHNRRRSGGELVVDKRAVADARYRRSPGAIERPAPERWRPGQNMADVVVKRVHERQVWDETRAVLAVLREAADRRQRSDWRAFYQRRELERREDPELKERHKRERAALGREHGREGRELEEVAARKHREAMESPIRSAGLDPRAIADELTRMETELPEADRAAFRQQVQGPPGRMTLNIDRGRDRGGFER